MKEIRKALNLLPEKYKDQIQFINCADFLKHYEFGLALESLIELANEIEYIFPRDYWNYLMIAADKMRMEKEAAYCKIKLKNIE